MADSSIEPVNDVLVLPWEREADESETWYARFIKYYVSQGVSRSLTRAYIMYLAEEKPQLLAETGIERRTASSEWSNQAKMFKWRQRAEAYDIATSVDMAKAVDAARQKLFESAERAATALAEALENPKSKVSAAKEILDRVGLPATQVHVNKNVNFTADDLMRAQQEVGEWEQNLKQTPKSNG